MPLRHELKFFISPKQYYLLSNALDLVQKLPFIKVAQLEIGADSLMYGDVDLSKSGYYVFASDPAKQRFQPAKLLR